MRARAGQGSGSGGPLLPVLATLAGGLVGLSCGVLLGGLEPQTFVAEAHVAIDVQLLTAPGDRRPQTVSLDSEAQVLRSGRVLQPAAQTSRFPGGQLGLGEALQVGAVPNTRILIVRVTTEDQTTADRAVDALVDVFVTTRNADAGARAGAAVARLREQVSAVSGQLAVVRASRSTDDEGGDVPLAQERALAQQLASLEAEISRLGATSELSTTVPLSRSSSAEPRTVLLVSSLAVGSAAGTALGQLPATRALVRQVRSERTRSSGPSRVAA